MASLRQKKKRTDRVVSNGAPHTGTHIVWAPPVGGFVRAVGTEFTLTIGDHVAHLSQDEVLDTMRDWMVEYIRLRNTGSVNAKS